MGGGPLALLADTQQRVNSLLKSVDDKGIRTQYHPDLSPLGWHLGHCVFTECYWVQEVLRGDNTQTARLARLYVPPTTPKSDRGANLPAKQDLLDWATEQQRENLHLLASVQPNQHKLLTNDYLTRFLIQHYCQHYETMVMVLTQRAMQPDPGTAQIDGTSLSPSGLDKRTVSLPPGNYQIGGSLPSAYDNELPQHTRELDGTGIAQRPTSNGEYLAFIEDGGYTRSEHWSPAGFRWRDKQSVKSPLLWHKTTSGDWYGIGLNGFQTLNPEEPVTSISQHEAYAYASWAGGRLPDEYEWESACRENLLEDSGQVWEWCANTFRPYQGFQAFPYPEYSQPWFDDRHFTLKGGSCHTLAPIKRPSFRNFYNPETRYLFAGVRVVYS